MFNTEINDLFDGMDAIEALRALSSNTERAVVSRRAGERIDIQTDVLLRPGNASQRHDFVRNTITADISSGGCMLLSPAPATVGDIYWLEFSGEAVHIGSLLGRCMRCRMVSEVVFEIGIKFLVPIDLESALNVAKSQ